MVSHIFYYFYATFILHVLMPNSSVMLSLILSQVYSNGEYVLISAAFGMALPVSFVGLVQSIQTS